MSKKLICFVLGVCTWQSPVAGASMTNAEAVTRAPAQQALLDQARLWVSRQRDDLALATLDKLQNIAPNEPDALALRATIALRARRTDELQAILARLRQISPDHPALARIASLERLEGRDKDKLKQARLLAKNGKTAAALAELNVLYPDGPPSGELALEYWQLAGSLEKHRRAAEAGLAALMREEPYNLRYRLALAQQQTSRRPVSLAAIKTLNELSAVPQLARQARSALRSALLRLDSGPASILLIKTYVEQEQTTDTAVREYLDRMILSQAQQRTLMADINYRALLDGVALLGEGKLDVAEAKLELALTARPADPDALGALGRLRLAQGHHGEAQAYFVQAGRLDGARAAEWRSLARTAQYWGLLRESGDASNGGEFRLAEQKALEARKLEPRVAAASIVLGRIYSSQQRDAEAEQAFRAALLVAPADIDNLSALANFYARAGREAEAVALMARMPAAQRQAFESERNIVRAALLRGQGEALLAQQQTSAAQPLFEQAAALDLDNPWLRYDLARLYAAGGEAEKAQDLFERLLVRRADDPEARFAFALFLSGQARETEALAMLAPVAPQARSAGMTDLQRQLELAVVLQRAASLEQNGQSAAALQALASARSAMPDDVRLLYAEARLLRGAGRFAQAAQNYRQILRVRPAESAAATGLIATLIASGELVEANDELARQLAALPVDAPDFAADLADLLLDMRDDARAARLLDTALARAPEHVRLLAYASELAQKKGDLGRAITYLQRSIASEQAQDLRRAATVAGLESSTPADSQAYERRTRRHALLQDSSANWVSSSFDKRTRSGSAGMSALNASELLLEWKRPQDANGRLSLQANVVDIKAGTLDLASQDARNFGSMLLCQSDCASGLSAQQAKGLALSATLERKTLRLDVGTTPLGFPVSNLVGGVLSKGDLGPFSTSFDASRRALTGSLLSYAGSRDPRTGTVWGGVLATGVRVGLSRDDGGTVGAWSSFGWHALSGKNVQDNQRLQLMAGLIGRLINKEDQLLTVGLTGMAWRYSENAGEYTFGHGGYYSPQDYKSLSLPVNYGQRYARLSYWVRAAVSRSQSRSNAADYFPTDATMQQQAQAQYAGSAGGASGRSLALAAEYQLLPDLFIGTRIEIERSPDYAPNRFLLYVRYAADRHAARPVSFPPEALASSIQY